MNNFKLIRRFRTPILAAIAILATTQSAFADGSWPVKFEAYYNGNQVKAPCNLNTPSGKISFITPAKIDISLDSTGRAMIKSLTCKVAGITRKTTRIPGTETRIVTIDFTSKKANFWFKRLNKSVLYYMRGEKLVIVSGSSEP